MIDPEPLQGINRYRLRQVDITGEVSYSNVVEVYFDGESMALYPNPVNAQENLMLRLTIAEARPVFIQMWNVSGQMVVNTRENPYAGTQMISLPTAGLSPGTYLVKVNMGNKQMVEKVVIR